MRLTASHAALALALLGGCAGPVRTTQLGPDHPASPAAAEAPLPPPSSTLAVDRSATPSPEARGVVSPQVEQPGEPAPKSDTGHAGHAAAPGTQVPTPPGRAATAPVGTLYACPMHPEVTSTNPNDRCPKCGMKVNKPVKPATAPAVRPTSGAAPQPHQHDHTGGNK